VKHLQRFVQPAQNTIGQAFRGFVQQTGVRIRKINFDLTMHNESDSLKVTYLRDLPSVFLLFILRELKEFYFSLSVICSIHFPKNCEGVIGVRIRATRGQVTLKLSVKL
jgi:hypothetical protein